MLIKVHLDHIVIGQDGTPFLADMHVRWLIEQ